LRRLSLIDIGVGLVQFTLTELVCPVDGIQAVNY